MFPSRPRLHGSSRTDTGVHALGLVAHFEVPAAECKMSSHKLGLALNAWLPQDIRVVAATRTRPAFHARFEAKGKQYRYFVWNHPAMNPLIRPFGRFNAIHGLFVGRHDFRSFTTNPGYARESTIRTLTRCEIRRQGPLLTFIIEGEGFLYRMCRSIVGTLVQVGLGKFRPEAIPAMLRQKDRRLAGMTAPAHGLVLWRVKYK